MKSTTKKGMGAAVALAAWAAAAPATAQAPNPNEVYINGIAYAGTGCPAGSVSDNLSPDLQAFTLLFDSYVASVGPGIAFTQKTKNCTITVKLHVPQGWSYTLQTVDYRGYMDLQPGVNGTQLSTYYFAGSGRTARLSTTYRGPDARDYHIRDTLALDSLVWSPCGENRDLVINSRVSVENNRAPWNSGLLTTDTIDGQLTHVYGIRWQRCH